MFALCIWRYPFLLKFKVGPNIRDLLHMLANSARRVRFVCEWGARPLRRERSSVVGERRERRLLSVAVTVLPSAVAIISAVWCEHCSLSSVSGVWLLAWLQHSLSLRHEAFPSGASTSLVCFALAALLYFFKTNSPLQVDHSSVPSDAEWHSNPRPIDHFGGKENKIHLLYT